MTALMVLAGGMVGLGAFLFIWEVRPAPPRLDAALARLGGSESPNGHDRSPGVSHPIGGWLAVRFTGTGGLPLPRRDLSLVGQPVERFLLAKLGCLLLGLVLPAALGLVLLAAGLSLPWAIPAGAGVAAAALLFFLPDVVLRDNARKRRADFRHATTSYLDLVALERSGGAAPNEAIEAAALTGQGWAFRRIAEVLERARRAQVPPWAGLARLGNDVGVAELADLADIAELAGNEGAKILDTLMAKAESMRSRSLAEARAQANSRTTTMTIPVVMLGAGLILLLIFPQVYRLLSG